MDLVAVKMLVADRRRYLVILTGVGLSTFLIAHQLAVFAGVMDRTTSLIRDAHPDGIWVMDPGVLNLDDADYLPEHALLRVRGCDGVEWAMPFYKNQAVVRRPDGGHRGAIVVGLDDSTLAGLPARMVAGDRRCLFAPDAVVIDDGGYTYLWPGEPVTLGRELEINGRRAVVAGVCKGAPPFMSVPVIYTRMGAALRYCPRPAKPYTFILVTPRPGVPPAAVCAAIQDRTGLRAVTTDEFVRITRAFYRENTAIVYNFAIVVGLGFLVGAATAGQTFYTFVDHHITQFAGLKAMGLSAARLGRMVVVQAVVAWGLGFPLGLGLAAAVLGISTEQAPYLGGFVLTWRVAGEAAAGTLTIMAVAGLAALWRVWTVEAAIAVRG